MLCSPAKVFLVLCVTNRSLAEVPCAFRGRDRAPYSVPCTFCFLFFFFVCVCVWGQLEALRGGVLWARSLLLCALAGIPEDDVR